jgi:hypothetical protein
MVEHLIMANNSACFHLTEDTSPMMECLLSDLGYLAETGTAEQILNDTYICLPGTDEYMRDFLQIMEFPHNIAANDKIGTSFTITDFQA